METFKTILISPYIIAVIWPVVFVVVQTLFIVVNSERTTAKGATKYKVWYRNKKREEPHSGPESLGGIVDLFNNGKEIVEIVRLEDSYWGMFSFGLDLCISALATDITMAFAFAPQDPLLVQLVLAILVFHLLVLTLVMLMLLPPTTPRSQTMWVWIANLFGIVAMTVPLYYFGDVLIK